jgi:4'-phosphopantetheinyl transferase
MEKLLGQLCPWRYEKAMQLRNPAGRVTSVAAGLFLQQVLWEKYGIPAAKIKIVLGEQGKPCLMQEGTRQALHFNLSHSGNYVVLAISDENVGIDIECKDDKGLRVAKRCLAEEEYRYIQKQPEEKQMQAFRRIWTMKESFLKYTGTGISVPLSSFTVDGEKKQAVTAEGQVLEFALQSFTDEAEAQEYAIAVCSRNVTAIQWQKWELHGEPDRETATLHWDDAKRQPQKNKN